MAEKKDWMRETYLKNHPEKRASIEAREGKKKEFNENMQKRMTAAKHKALADKIRRKDNSYDNTTNKVK